MNPENGLPTCESCQQDLYQDESISLVLPWDPDTDFNQVTMCLNCVNGHIKQAIKVCINGVWFNRETEPKGPQHS